MLLMEEVASQVSSTDMTNGLNLLQTVFTYLAGCVKSVVDIILANWLLLIPIGIALAFTVVRFVRSIFNIN